MSKRDWIKPLASGLIAIAITLVCAAYYLGSQLGETRGERNHHSASYERNASDQISNICLMGEGVDVRECVAKIINATNEQQRAEDDRVAQMEMARWAFWMLVVTVIMAAVTTLGVVFVWMTLRETREMSRDQSRAYVHAEKAFFFWGGEKQANPRVEVWVQNTGQTPAHWYEIRLKEFVYEPKEIDHNFPIIDQVKLPDRFEGPWNGVPSGGEGRKSTFIFKDEAEVREIAKAGQDKYGLSIPSHGFSIVGEIRYKTFFGEIFVSQFAFGRAFLPAYQIEETRTREVDHMTINDHIEKPIPLARYAAHLKTYERQS